MMTNLRSLCTTLVLALAASPSTLNAQSKKGGEGHASEMKSEVQASGKERVPSRLELDRDAVAGIMFAAEHSTNHDLREFAQRAMGHLKVEGRQWVEQTFKAKKMLKNKDLSAAERTQAEANLKKITAEKDQGLMDYLAKTLADTETPAGKKMSAEEWRTKLHSTFAPLKP